jgi:hypothetical protein
VVSDWSLEVEEEEERRSLDGASPFRTEEHPHQHSSVSNAPPSGPGIIRLAAVDPVPLPHPAWRSVDAHTWRQQAAGAGYHTLPGPAQHPQPQRSLYDPNSPVRPVRMESGIGWADRQSSPDYPGPPFSNVRIPMATSRSVPKIVPWKKIILIWIGLFSFLFYDLKEQSHEIFDLRFFFINQSHFGH